MSAQTPPSRVSVSPPVWLPVRAGAWSGKAPIRAAAGALRAQERLGFQRACLPYLHVLIGPHVLETPEMGGWDAAGADHLAWGDGGPLEAVVQCKGFLVGDADVGRGQAAQCVRSVESFAGSGLRTRGYLLLHNRDGRNAEFREPVDAALAALVKSGAAGWAQCWSPRQFLQAVCDALAPRVDAAWRRAGREQGARAARLLGSETVTAVPFRRGRYRFSGSGLPGGLDAGTWVGDPVDALDAEDGVSLLLGGFGQGKTTTALRLADRLGRRALYLPAARLRDQPSGRSMFEHALDLDAVTEGLASEALAVAEPLVPVVAELLLSQPRDDVLLIVDGLDESPAAHRRNGLAQVLNSVAWTRVPVVLTMRTEFWHARSSEIEGALNASRGAGTALPAVELAPWGDEEVLALVRLARESATNGEVAGHLDGLRGLLADHEWHGLYGDIPSRPLFLRMLIDVVAADGPRRLGPVELVDAWVEGKLRRDWAAPEAVEPGGGHRPGLGAADETVDTTADLAWLLMDTAAGLTLPSGPPGPTDSVELDAEVAWDRLVATIPWLTARPDFAATCTQTLLMPLPHAGGGRARRVAFAHRALQDFFAARHVRRYPREPALLPPGVAVWAELMKDARYP